MDHSLRPDTHMVPLKHIKADCFLPIFHINLPIGYCTQFTASGWGSRRLTSNEMGKLWNLKGPHSFTWPLLIPVDILRMLLKILARNSLVIQKTENDRSTTNLCERSMRRFCPIVGVLPCTWQEDILTMVSSKSDSAKTPIHFLEQADIFDVSCRHTESFYSSATCSSLQTKTPSLQGISIIFVRCLPNSS